MYSAAGSFPACGSLDNTVNFSVEHGWWNDLCVAVKIQIRKCHMAVIIIPVTFHGKNNSLDAEQLNHVVFLFLQMNGYNRGAVPLFRYNPGLE